MLERLIAWLERRVYGHEIHGRDANARSRVKGTMRPSVRRFQGRYECGCTVAAGEPVNLDGCPTHGEAPVYGEWEDLGEFPAHGIVKEG